MPCRTGSARAAHGRRGWGIRPDQMVRSWKAEILQTIEQCFLGGIVLGPLTFACFSLGFSVATSGFIFMAAIVLLSLRVNFAASTILSFAAVACLNYYFTPPIFT